MPDRYIVNGGDGRPVFLVEALPRVAVDEQLASLRSASTGGQLLNDLSQVGEAVIAACEGIYGKVEQALSTASPDEVEIEFAVGLSAEGGLPVFAKLSSEATFNIRATWKRK